MTIVKELNELAEKMTGTNPRATTDAQAMDFIEQHYQNGGGGDTPSGGGSEPLVFDISNGVNAFYDNDEADTEYILTSAETNALGQISTSLTANPNQVVNLDAGEGQYIIATSVYNSNTQLTLSGEYVYMYTMDAHKVSVLYIYVADGSIKLMKREFTGTASTS